MPISTPSQIVTPWAESGLKNAIPQNADPINGLAGFDQGFPAINMVPKTAGGIPPFGQDFNGIFYDLTVAMQYLQAGGSFPYDGAWAAAVGGYPVGALVSRTDNQGLWRNTVANNVTDPEAGGAGWQPEGSGATTVAMSSSNVTLTALEASRGIIIISGTLTADLQLIFPTYVKQWLVVNNATGAFTVTCKTASGTGVISSSGISVLVYGDGVNIYDSVQAGFDYLNTLRIDIASASTIDLSVAAPNTRHINITGTTAITGFTVAAGQCYFVRFAGALTLTNGAGLVTQSGANIITAAGDTCIIRATAANVVEVLAYTPAIPQALGYRQTWQNVTASRAASTTYTNTTGRPIQVMITVNWSDNPDNFNFFVDGVAVLLDMEGGLFSWSSPVAVIVPAGSTYSITANYATPIKRWMELR